jgi:hypothetical protein
VEATISFKIQAANFTYFNRFFLITLSLISLTVFLATPSFAKDYTFSWSANSGAVDGYKFYYKKGGSAGPPFDGYDAFEGESPIDIPGLTSFTISGLEDNTTYHFALTAYDGFGESDFTDVITVYTGDDQQVRITKVLTIINNYLLLE